MSTCRNSSKRKKTNKKPDEYKCDTEQELTSEELQQKADEEISWCIDRLQIDLSSKQYSEREERKSVQVLKTLMSKVAPLVKKRQVMRATFGDYRSLMSEERRKGKMDVIEMKMVPVEKCDKHPFIRTHNVSKLLTNSNESTIVPESNFNELCASPKPIFCFNFPVTVQNK